VDDSPFGQGSADATFSVDGIATFRKNGGPGIAKHDISRYVPRDQNEDAWSKHDVSSIKQPQSQKENSPFRRRSLKRRAATSIMINTEVQINFEIKQMSSRNTCPKRPLRSFKKQRTLLLHRKVRPSITRRWPRHVTTNTESILPSHRPRSMSLLV
jgi:hypothetical protein